MGHCESAIFGRGTSGGFEEELEYCSMNKGEVARIGAEGGNGNWSLLFTLNGGRNMGRVAVGRLVISPVGGRIHAKVGVVTPSLSSVPSAHPSSVKA